MEQETFNYQTDERFADIQMLRYRLNGFEQLTLQQKLYIYYLSEATLWGRDITFDQFGRYNLQIRRVPCFGDLSEARLVLEWYLSSLWLREVRASLLCRLPATVHAAGWAGGADS